MQAHITGLPQEVLATPLGQMLAPMLSPLEQQLGNIHQQPAGESGPASQTAQGNTVAAAGTSRPSPVASSQQVCETSLPVLNLPACVCADWQQVQSTCCLALVRYNVRWACTFSPIIWDIDCHAFVVDYFVSCNIGACMMLIFFPEALGTCCFSQVRKRIFVQLDHDALL